MNKTEKELAAKVAQALHSSQSALATKFAYEYLVEAIQNDLQDSGAWDDPTPETFWDHCLENLEVEIMDGLISLIPDAEWNEDENQGLVSSFMATVHGLKDKVVGEVEDYVNDGRSARDPYSYHGVKRSDF